MSALQIVILAAGQGKRMYSNTPKVLHCLAGKPMLKHVIDTALTLHPKNIHVVVGHGATQIQEAIGHQNVTFSLQDKQLGTGHAVMQALPHIKDNDAVLILSGDVPLIDEKTLNALVLTHNSHQGLTLLVANVESPLGLGRIVRNEHGEIQSIVEEKDASEILKKINEIYSGVCIANAADLKRWLPTLNANNAQGEYYLTEIVNKAKQEGMTIKSETPQNTYEISGVNNRAQLHHLERIYQKNYAERLLDQGVYIADAHRFDVRGTLICGKDVFIDVNTVFLGRVQLEDGVKIGPNCVISNSYIGAHSEIEAHSVIDGSTCEEHCHIGPFARLRPGTVLASTCKIGNFVETKNIQMDMHSKASHLSYLGDAMIGKNVNIGAGTITCNYDGANKHQTIIEDGVFIGSDTQLVAPVRVGENATIGAGSTIRKDVPAQELTLTATSTKTVKGWKRPVKKKP